MARGARCASASRSGRPVHVSGGKLLNSKGQQFVVKGIAVLDSLMSTEPVSGIISLFPNINAISLACGADGPSDGTGGFHTAQSNASIISYVNAATAIGLVVFISDYQAGQPGIRTGADLTASCTWYSTLATAFVNNSRVWWTTENEVDGDLATAHQAIYAAIRGTGNTAPIFMESWNGIATSTVGLSAPPYSAMTNVGWNIHFYPWEFNGLGFTTQPQFDNQAKTYVASFEAIGNSLDGVMPVLMGEGGNSTVGSSVVPDDVIVAGKYACVQAIINTAGVTGGTCGWLMWLHDWHGEIPPSGTDSDTLVNTHTTPRTLTPYGQQTADGM